MPRFRADRRQKPSIGDLSARVIVCTWVERPDADISVIKTRPGVFSCQARIISIKGSTVLDYQTVWGENAPTHEIVIRSPPDVVVALNHWIYHDDAGGRKVWYRIRNVEETGGYVVMLCNIDTYDDSRTDLATQSPDPQFEEPKNVVRFP